MATRDADRTFLFSDVEGSTLLLRKRPDLYPHIIATQRKLILAEAARHGGMPLGHEGDSCFVVFENASDAVDAAGNAQRALCTHEWPEGAEVRVRFGVHTGPAEKSGDDYFGLAVHIAARVCDSGHGGQVIVSAPTRALVTSDLWTWQDKGSHRLRGIDVPIGLYQLEGRGLPTAFPPLRTVLAAPSLRTPATSFVGRRRETEELARMLTEARLVTVLGPGGIGKTRLALNVGADSAARYPDGVWFTDLTTTNDPATVADVIAESTRVAVQAGGSTISTLVEFFTRKQALLILDNFEHVMSAATVVSRLLRETTGLRILATSRERLRIYGEQAFVIEPLSLGAEGSAAQLFCDRARAVKPEFLPSTNDLDAIARICARLDGLPLAIELAAAQCRLLTPVEIALRLERRVMSLPGGPRDVHERQTTIRKTIEWSHQLLTAEERELLTVLAVFSGSPRLDAIAAVADDRLDWETSIAGLIDKSLVHPRTSPGSESRFGMLVLVKEFAGEQLADRSDREDLARAHAGYFTEWALEANDSLFRSHPDQWVRRIEEDLPELSQAFAWSLAHDRLQATKLFGALGFFFHRTGMTHLARRWRDAVADIEVPDDVAAARAMASGYVEFGFRNLSAARISWTKALELTRSIGDQRGESWALMSLAGSCIGSEERYDDARRLAREGIRLAEVVGSGVLVGLGYNVIGEVARVMGDDNTAEEAYRTGMEVAREVGDRLREGILNGNCVYIATHQDDFDRAVRSAETAITIHLSEGHRNHLPWVAIALAGALERRGDVETSCLLLGAAEESARRMLFEEMPGDVSENARIRARIRDTAGVRFEEWQRRGADQPIDAALRFALRELGSRI